MSIIERILYFIEYKGITKYEFHKVNGFSNGFLDKNRAIGSDKCEKILENYPEISPEWLITGKGEMLKNSEQNITQNGNNNTNNGHNISGKVKKIEQKIEQTNAELLEIIREKDRQIASLHKIIEKLSN
ncbi:transcriptional regulator [Capnocytophaga canimorsus]|uniref:transcriptional regulator n=1 Tax=Capnocytophaga canimorsus TaxID=28188 RepID=UPI00384E17D1